MYQNICDNSYSASVFLDILSHLEKLADISLNIANRTFVAYKKHENKYLDPKLVEKK